MDLRSFIKNINVLNSILVAACLIFAANFLFPQGDSNVSFVLPALKKVPMQKPQNEPPKVQSPSPMDYVAIADENLFHPERKIPPEKKEEAALPKPEFVLFGTLISPNLSMAYMEDKKAPVTTPGRGQRQSALKKGESLSGYTVKEITANKVVMARGEETLMVLLDDPKAPKTREASGAAGPQKMIPGIAGPNFPTSTAGQPSMSPTASQQNTMTSGGIPPRPLSPSPAGVGSFPQPPPSTGISPSMPSSGAFPSRRQRMIPPTTP